MYSILAALLNDLVDREEEKLKVMNSMIGRSPTIAAPTPMPAKPSSVIGVSTTRISPNFSSMPFDTLYAPSYARLPRP